MWSKQTGTDAVEVVLARVGRAHGVRGQVYLDIRTDRPDSRFVLGQNYTTDAASPGTLTLTELRPGPKGTIAAFDQVNDREAAQALRGVALIAQVDPRDEDNAWYPKDLRGLPVELPDGTKVGQVRNVLTRPAQDLLEIDQLEAGEIALVPLVQEVVPVVDPAAGRIIIDPPPGLVVARPDPDGIA